MRPSNNQHEKLVLVCTNERTDGRECCVQKGSLELYEKLKTAIKAACQNVRVSKTGCLGNCESGITVAIMPRNIYLGEVTLQDIPEIVRLVRDQ
ncbi:(2Fe-2S) ferredoxin domain-containing protein [Candidatus Uhrbacteria bacterium]|nr:(2Fe-2S) ferredoxin domain-containing protein [Candidatus Uhrbacteria bacterium]